MKITRSGNYNLRPPGSESFNAYLTRFKNYTSIGSWFLKEKEGFKIWMNWVEIIYFLTKLKQLQRLRIHKPSIDFMAIQETKLELITANVWYQLWCSEDCDWFFLTSEGNSGGLLSLWNKSKSKLIFTFVGDCWEWRPLKKRCYVCLFKMWFGTSMEMKLFNSF